MSIRELSPKTRSNLDALASYLEQLPIDYKHFNMSAWVQHKEEHEYKVVRYAKENGGVASIGCGTVACAVGHGPAAGILVDPSYITRYNSVMWAEYARNEFTEYSPRIMFWLFSGAWDNVDNTHRGAAARIRLLLNEPDKIPPVDEIERELYTSSLEEDGESLRALYSKYLVE